MLKASQMTHEIRINGAHVMKGDPTSIKVIFHNLTGKNFEHAPAYTIMTHDQYLAMMEQELKVSLRGSRLDMAEVGKDSLAWHQF